MKLKEALLHGDWRAERLRSEAAQSLPCLNRNISIEETQGGEAAKVFPVETKVIRDWRAKQEKLNEFSTAHRKSAYALELNVKAFIDRWGLNHVGFLTLTFNEHITDPKEAQRRFNSLRTNYLRHRYPHYIRVIERQKSGRIHYHLLVSCKEDIRRGLNFRQIAARNYETANPAIRKHWSSLRAAMRKYGFGRSELLPVKTNSKGLARYVAKYIGKHIDSRISADKGVRLCQTSQDKGHKWKVATSNFQFASPGSKLWRQKLKKWVHEMDCYFFGSHLTGGYFPRKTDYIPITEQNYSERLTKLLGAKWAYSNRETIAAMPL